MRWGDYPGLFRGTQCNHKGPYKRAAGGSKAKEGDGIIEAEVGMKGFEDERKGNEPRNASGLQRLEEKRK